MISASDWTLTLWTITAATITALYLDTVFDFFKRRRLRKANRTAATTATATMNAPAFHAFSDLHEDLQLNILSFIATVPHEFPHAIPKSTVTGVLPHVSKQLYEFCQLEYFWESALKRLCEKDAYLWKEGLKRIITPLQNDSNNADALLQAAHRLQTYPQIFRSLYENYILYTAPVFYMTGIVRLGREFGLHFFEPRYRVLIREVMQNWPDSAKQGGPVEANEEGRFPTFVYAHMTPLAPTTPACIVQVKSCRIYQDGTADVHLCPISYIWIKSLRERQPGRLFEATCLRMGSCEASQMEPAGPGSRDNREVWHTALNGGDPPPGAMHAILSYLMSGEDDDNEEDDEAGEEEHDDDWIDMEEEQEEEE